MRKPEPSEQAEEERLRGKKMNLYLCSVQVSQGLEPQMQKCSNSMPSPESTQAGSSSTDEKISFYKK